MEVLDEHKTFKEENSGKTAFSNLSVKILSLTARTTNIMRAGTTNTSTQTAATVLPNPSTAAPRRSGKKHKNRFSGTTKTVAAAITTRNALPSAGPNTHTKAAATTSNTCRAICNTVRQFALAAILLAFATKGFSSSTRPVNATEFDAITASTDAAAADEARIKTTTTTTAPTLRLEPTTTINQSAAFWQSGTNHSLNGVGQQHFSNTSHPLPSPSSSSSSSAAATQSRRRVTAAPSFFSQFAKRLSSGNELWDGIIADCYEQPTFSCFQKNVYAYLNDALDANDVNVTQRLKFFRNQVIYDNLEREKEEAKDSKHTERGCEDRRHYEGDGDIDGAAAAAAAEVQKEDQPDASGKSDGAKKRLNEDEHLLKNEIPHEGRAAAETPIEEVTNALYGKSVKFALTHDIELRLPEVLFDGATFRISPRSLEGNGMIAKLELIPKQEVEARLAGKILMKKIQKFLRSKIMLSFLALLLIIKIIKIKLFWLLPVIIGVGAAKKVLLKFLLFLFPALSHLFKLCSYYHQTYHSTKYHHHHHLINHHHTVVPPWHNSEHHSGPEIIYTSPPKGLPSSAVYVQGAPLHGESYAGPFNSHEHYDDGWVNSGPGLGSEYISDINRVAQIDENSNYFKPHTANDANELSTWGLAPTQSAIRTSQRVPVTQQQRPPPALNQQQQQQQQQQHGSSHGFNPFINSDKQSIFTNNVKLPSIQHQHQHQQHQQLASVPGPVYAHAPPRQGAATMNAGGSGLNAAQIAAQYESSQQQQNSPLLSAQLKEALRIQAEQRIVAQQQKILENQPFAQDGQPIMPKNYDPFYSPILLKIDKILEQLGVKDNLCKERLVCSMYKDPNRYSPHSNFVSAELSRDTNELQPVANANAAVIRFYRLIQAARDGQDQKDCLRIYAQCNINTE